jgi:hypothetical protein
MSTNLTSGFDILIQLSEDEINNQIQELFLGGELEIPSSFNFPFNFPGFNGSANINLGMPEVFLDQASPRVRIDFAVEDSQIITSGIPIGGLGGEISIEHPITVLDLPSAQQVVLNFASATPSVNFTFDAFTTALITPVLPAGITINNITDLVALEITDILINDIVQLSITPAIPTSTTDPMVPANISVKTLNDTSAADRDALVFGVDMITGSPGNLGGVTTNFIPNGEESILMLSNDWLLGEIIRPQLASSLGIPLASIDRPLTLNNNVPAPGGEGTLTALTASVVGNRIRITGRAIASGTGWNAVATFSLFVDLSLVDGSIVVTTTAPVVDTDVDLEWWVWLTTLGIGAILGGIIGIIVAAIVTAIAESIIEGIANNMISTGITSGLDALPTFPLGPIGAGLSLESIILDDLELHGSIIKAYRIPTFYSGGMDSHTAFALDLETGRKYGFNESSSDIDLKYHPSTGVRFVNGSKYSNSGTSYGALTPLGVRNMPLSSINISKGNIPNVMKIPFFSSGNELVIGIRTNKGRLAKARIFNDVLKGKAFSIDWVTYDTVVPSVKLTTRWNTREFGTRLDPRLVNGECCPAYEAAKDCRIEAVTKKLAFPIDLQWCIDGIVLKDSSGIVDSKSGSLDYTIQGRFLTLHASMSQLISSEVCLSAIDSSGLEVFKCTKINSSGIGSDCPSKRLKILPVYEYLPIISTFKKPIKLSSVKFNDVIQKALVIE